MKKKESVPKLMQDKFNAIQKETDTFCEQFLNNDYKQIIDSAIAALSRKRPSPLLKGKDKTWAAGIINAIGTINFLFDPSQTPHCKASEIYSFFGIAKSTAQNKSKEIRELLKIDYFSTEWFIPQRIDQSPIVWLVSVNGLLVDVRTMSLEIQEEAYRKGLIPYIPANRQSDIGEQD